MRESEMRGFGAASFALMDLMASVLWRSCSRRKVWLSFWRSVPYRAQVASVACRRPASLRMKCHQEWRGLMARELMREPDLSEG